jgi:hypothetical protein
MIQVLAGHHPGKQAGCSHAAIDHGRWDRLCGDGFASFARILRTNVAVDEKSGGFHIQLFGDVFANFDQIVAALITLAELWFMTMLDAR